LPWTSASAVRHGTIREALGRRRPDHRIRSARFGMPWCPRIRMIRKSYESGRLRRVSLIDYHRRHENHTRVAVARPERCRLDQPQPARCLHYLVDEDHILKGQVRGKRLRLTDDERRRHPCLAVHCLYSSSLMSSNAGGRTLDLPAIWRTIPTTPVVTPTVWRPPIMGQLSRPQTDRLLRRKGNELPLV
jgi:hypothetical protein